MSKLFAIGDIHGCANTLASLLSKIHLNKKDHLVFIGDYIDRGFSSKKVIDIILEIQSNGYSVTTLKGNHEQMMIDSETDDDEYIHWVEKNGGRFTLQSFEILNYSELEKKYQQFFDRLLYYKEIAPYIFVHAGINFQPVNIFEDKQAMLWQRPYSPFVDFINYQILLKNYINYN
jgi:serine/threonine protein phosphatase 1